MFSLAIHFWYQLSDSSRLGYRRLGVPCCIVGAAAMARTMVSMRAAPAIDITGCWVTLRALRGHRKIGILAKKKPSAAGQMPAEGDVHGSAVHKI
jgi:hypothetical protein